MKFDKVVVNDNGDIYINPEHWSVSSTVLDDAEVNINKCSVYIQGMSHVYLWNGLYSDVTNLDDLEDKYIIERTIKHPFCKPKIKRECAKGWVREKKRKPFAILIKNYKIHAEADILKQLINSYKEVYEI